MLRLTLLISIAVPAVMLSGCGRDAAHNTQPNKSRGVTEAVLSTHGPYKLLESEQENESPSQTCLRNADGSRRLVLTNENRIFCFSSPIEGFLTLDSGIELTELSMLEPLFVFDERKLESSLWLQVGRDADASSIIGWIRRDETAPWDGGQVISSVLITDIAQPVELFWSIAQIIDCADGVTEQAPVRIEYAAIGKSLPPLIPIRDIRIVDTPQHAIQAAEILLPQSLIADGKNLPESLDETNGHALRLLRSSAILQADVETRYPEFRPRAVLSSDDHLVSVWMILSQQLAPRFRPAVWLTDRDRRLTAHLLQQVTSNLGLNLNPVPDEPATSVKMPPFLNWQQPESLGQFALRLGLPRLTAELDLPRSEWANLSIDQRDRLCRLINAVCGTRFETPLLFNPQSTTSSNISAVR